MTGRDAGCAAPCCGAPWGAPAGGDPDGVDPDGDGPDDGGPDGGGAFDAPSALGAGARGALPEDPDRGGVIGSPFGAGAGALPPPDDGAGFAGGAAFDDDDDDDDGEEDGFDGDFEPLPDDDPRPPFGDPLRASALSGGDCASAALSGSAHKNRSDQATTRAGLRMSALHSAGR